MTAYPMTGFRFKVLFSGLEEEVDMSFQEVGGLEMNPTMNASPVWMKTARF